jgi:hypothetical protein
MHWRPAGALVTAALVAVISIPVIQDAMRDQSPSMVPQAGEPNVVGPDRVSSDCATADCTRQDEAMSEPAQTRLSDVAGEPPSPAQALAASPVEAEGRRETAAAETRQEAAFEAVAPVVAAPPPPSPPPPPPPSEPEAEGSRNIVVTGSRIPTANMAKQSLADEMGNAAKPASPSTLVDPIRTFLSRLQAGLRANDRRAVVGLVGFPLRVNRGGGTRTYRSLPDVERDFDRIFTPQVRLAVLNQRPDALVSRDGGRMIGNGRLWFGPTCSGRSCSADSTIRIREVNP